MSAGGPPRPPGPAPTTVPPGMASREAILRRAHEAAQAHASSDSGDTKKTSSDWRDFFDDKQEVQVASRACTFNVYSAGPKQAPADGHKVPVVFCVHGGGYTGLSFALLAEGLKEECALATACSAMMLLHY